jgi:transcriptional regulator with XRE-family HTH domain
VQEKLKVKGKRIYVSFERAAMGMHTSDIYKQIGDKIRELRTSLKGKGISQEDLARAMKTTANTISRWETATYKPSISDLEKLARFFGVSLSFFFPQLQPTSRMNDLVSATSDLNDVDLEEVTLYALFRRARRAKSRR